MIWVEEKWKTMMTKGLLITVYLLGIWGPKAAFDANAYVGLLKVVVNYICCCIMLIVPCC